MIWGVVEGDGEWWREMRSSGGRSGVVEGDDE